MSRWERVRIRILDVRLGDHVIGNVFIVNYRIANGEFLLDGKKYQLAVNNGRNSLHGGIKGFDKVMWDTIEVSETAITYQYVARDGEEGYPGDIRVSVRYELSDTDGLVIDFDTQLIKGQVSVVNLTNHTYFNLDGYKGDILDHELQVNGHSSYLELDKHQIPTGRVIVPEDSAYNFSRGMRLGDRIDQVQEFKGYDHFYLNEHYDGQTLSKLATLRSDKSGIQMDVYSTYFGFQLYTGNWLNGKIKRKSSQGYGYYEQYAGVCMETSQPPNAVNSSQFRELVRVREGVKHKTKYVFG
jgi:aldose 1-epimerase